ncbi:3495_t:CDS:2, partial [Racocetra persica]
HASSVEHYGVMNDRPNTPAPKQENKGKITVKALIDITSKSNTISKCLYNKLEEDYRLEDGTEVIDFQIHKNLLFDLVLEQDWLRMREAKISFGFSLENCKRYAKIEINDMSIPLIKKDSRPIGDSSSHKASSTKNNLSIAEQAVL